MSIENRIMKNLFLCLAVLFSASVASAQGLSQKDIHFATDAYRCGLLNLKLAELTITKAKSDSVRVLGRQLILDYTKANDQMKALAVEKNMAMPDSLSKSGQAQYDDLAARWGDDFDKTYVQLMITEHKKAIATFKAQEDAGSDAEVRTWTAANLPLLKHHLMTAEDLAVDLDKSRSRNKTGRDKSSSLRQ